MIEFIILPIHILHEGTVTELLTKGQSMLGFRLSYLSILSSAYQFTYFMKKL